MIRARLILTAALTLALTAPVFAQSYNENAAVYDRMERMERDLMLMQRQMSRGGSSQSAYSTGNASNAPVGGQVEVRLQQIEEQMRRLEGQVEEAKFQSQQAGSKLDKMQTDMEYRLNALEQRPAANTATIAPVPAEPEALAPSRTRDPVEEPTDAPAAEPDEAEAAPAATPRDAYNHAFKLLRESKHAEAGKEFETFVKKYPNDALTGNAYYWLGESYYVRRDYTKSADAFRLGYKTAPTGAKAADNLLKLAMSLSAAKNTKDACVVLKQVITKFGASNATAKQKANFELERNRCS